MFYFFKSNKDNNNSSETSTSIGLPSHQFIYNENDVLYTKLKKISIFCAVCGLPCCNTIKLQCGHRYCVQCFNSHQQATKGNASCKSCQRVIRNGTWNEDSESEGLFSELEVYCRRRPLGCDWKGMRHEHNEHDVSCSHIQCRNTEQGCEWIGKKNEEEIHFKTCEYVIIKCCYTTEFGCDYESLRKSIKEHENNCATRIQVLQKRQTDQKQREGEQKKQKLQIKSQSRREKLRYKAEQLRKSQVVKLNVGGKRFEASKDLLISQPSVFSEIFQNDDQNNNNNNNGNDEEYFVDCDEEGFKLVLYWYRSKQLPSVLKDRELELMIQTARYLEVEALMTFLSKSPRYRHRYLKFINSVESIDELLLSPFDEDDNDNENDIKIDENDSNITDLSNIECDDNDDDEYISDLNIKIGIDNMGATHYTSENPLNSNCGASHAIIAKKNETIDQNKDDLLKQEMVYDDTYHHTKFNSRNYQLFKELLLFRSLGNGQINLQNTKLRGESISGFDFTKSNIDHSLFDSCYLSDVVFKKTHAHFSIFNDCYLLNSDFSSASLYKSYFKNCNLSSSDLSSHSSNHLQFTSCNLIQTSFSLSKLNNNNFCYSKLKYANFTSCNLYNVMFLSSDMIKSNFTSATLTDVVFSGSKLHQIIFSHATISIAENCDDNVNKTIFRSCDFKNAKLNRISSSCYFVNCKFTDDCFTTAAKSHILGLRADQFIDCIFYCSLVPTCGFETSLEFLSLNLKVYHNLSPSYFQSITNNNNYYYLISNCVSPKSDYSSLRDIILYPGITIDHCEFRNCTFSFKREKQTNNNNKIFTCRNSIFRDCSFVTKYDEMKKGAEGVFKFPGTLFINCKMKDIFVKGNIDFSESFFINCFEGCKVYPNSSVLRSPSLQITNLVCSKCNRTSSGSFTFRSIINKESKPSTPQWCIHCSNCDFGDEENKREKKKRDFIKEDTNKGARYK